jgi:hypothetical protein
MISTTKQSPLLQIRCSAFDGFRRIAGGELSAVVPKVKFYVDRNPESSVLVFEDESSQIIDIDFRGTPEAVLERFERKAALGTATSNLVSSLQQGHAAAGRPKLGVVAREVTLLPRHWDWLNRQPGGASVALRRLVEEARKLNSGKDRVRESQETTYRFMSSIAGDLPGFEEALRALFAGDAKKFLATIDGWPMDVREHTIRIADNAFTSA